MVTDPHVIAALTPVPYKAELAEPYKGMEPRWNVYPVPLFTRIEIPTRLRRHENHRLNKVADELERCAAEIRKHARETDVPQEFLMLRVVNTCRSASKLIGLAAKC